MDTLSQFGVHTRIQRSGGGHGGSASPYPQLKSKKLYKVSASIQFLAIIDPPAKRHLNGVTLEGQWWHRFKRYLDPLSYHQLKTCCQDSPPPPPARSKLLSMIRAWFALHFLNMYRLSPVSFSPHLYQSLISPEKPPYLMLVL